MKRYFTSLATLLGCLLAAVLLSVPVGAADSTTEEYTVKAALVYNFARFTEWPDDAFDLNERTLKIMYYGDENLRDAFETVSGRMVGNRRIVVEYAAEPEDVIGCNLLFLARTEREEWPQILAAIEGDPILIIGEMNGFLESGGVVNLHLVKSKIRFQVNLDSARARELQISSQLLMLATSVIETEGAKD